MKLLPLRFIPLGLAAIFVITLGLISPAGNWLENTGSLILLIVLALVFPYLCFIWITTLMTPPSSAMAANLSTESDDNEAKNLAKAVNLNQNIASNIIGNITQNAAKKSSKIVDGGDDSNSIFLSLTSGTRNDLLNSSTEDIQVTESIPKAKSSLKKLFVANQNQSLNKTDQNKTNQTEVQESVSPIDPKAKPNPKNRSMRLRYRGAWLDND